MVLSYGIISFTNIEKYYIADDENLYVRFAIYPPPPPSGNQLVYISKLNFII